MSGKTFHYIFHEMQTHQNSISLGLPADPALAMELGYAVQELVAADTPEAQEPVLQNLAAIVTALSNLATESEIDLSGGADEERLQIYETVRKKFFSRLLLEGPGMTSSALSRFIDDHVNFIAEFNELGNRELVQRQRALART